MSSAAGEAPLGPREEDLEEATVALSPNLDIDKQNKEPNTSLTPRLPTVIRTHLIGWRFGVSGWVVAVIVTLFINIGLSVFVSYHHGFSQGRGTLLQGECSKITDTIGVHI
jgi:uncharacterized protein DUF6536